MVRFNIRLIDSKGKNIADNYKITTQEWECDTQITIQLLDDLPLKEVMFRDDISLLMDLLEDKIKYGDYVPKIRKMLELYDKLEKLLKENSING